MTHLHPATLRPIDYRHFARLSFAFPRNNPMDHVPVYTSLSTVYDNHLSNTHASDSIRATPSEEAEQRFARIKASFVDHHGAEPEYYARSPGRVNLIGEHIDYEGYGVLPMAIAQDTVVAVRRGGDRIVVANADGVKYPEGSFSTDPEQPVDVANGRWTNYFLAAYKGVHEFLRNKGLEVVLTGLQFLVHGEVPTGSGLSSSSALVCASSLALLSAYGILNEATKSEVAEFTCTCERHSGTESGGMDQAISIMARAGFAKVIEFNPVRGTDVSLPVSGIFVVANSLAVSNKAATANERYLCISISLHQVMAVRYNLRVVECRIAAMMLAYVLGLPKDKISRMKMLKEIQDLDDLKSRVCPLMEDEGRELDANGLCQALVQKYLRDEEYSIQEVEATLGLQLASVFQDSPNGLRVLNHLVSVGGGLMLHKRSMHVFSEAARVERAEAICKDSSLDDEEKVGRIGEVMHLSHRSTRDLYECSCPELEELIAFCNSFGAIGCRLTGAGWGGCIVALIKEGHQHAFIQNIKDTFYSKRIQSGQVTSIITLMTH